MSTVNDEILKELRSSLAAMSNDEFNSIMDSFEESRYNGATLGFEIDAELSVNIGFACKNSNVVLPVNYDYAVESYKLAA